MTQLVKYFQSQVFAPSEELTEAEAKSAGSYVAAYHKDGKVDHAEVYLGPLTEVIYYERALSDENMIEMHRAKYGDIPFQLRTSVVFQGNRRVRDIFHYDASGVLAGMDQEMLDDSGNVISEVRMDDRRQIVGTIEYEYDAQSRLTRVRELDPDGSVVDEFDPRT